MDERVVVGSENPVKVAATERIAESLFDATVRSVGVESGVAKQPRGHAETVSGAENRARRAFEADDGADYGVGIESGVADGMGDDPSERQRLDGVWLVMWAAVTDGTQLERSTGPSLRLPPAVAERVRAGDELGPVLDHLLGADGIGEQGGAAGALTAGAIVRESSLAHAVAGAFGPFVCDLY